MTRQPGTYAVFDTTEGQIVCRLFEKEAPITTKNFTDLAEGKRSWKDTVSGKSGDGSLPFIVQERRIGIVLLRYVFAIFRNVRLLCFLVLLALNIDGSGKDDVDDPVDFRVLEWMEELPYLNHSSRIIRFLLDLH